MNATGLKISAGLERQKIQQARLLSLINTLHRHPTYELEAVVRELRAIDETDSFIMEAIAHIRGANGKGDYRNHDHLQNLMWAQRSIRNYISERLDVGNCA